MTTPCPILDPLRATARRELLRFAVSRALFCECGVCLDVSRAVFLDSGRSSCVICSTCYERLRGNLYRKTGQDVAVELFDADGLCLVDGREFDQHGQPRPNWHPEPLPVEIVPPDPAQLNLL